MDNDQFRRPGMAGAPLGKWTIRLAAVCGIALLGIDSRADTPPANSHITGMWLITPSEFGVRVYPPLTPAAQKAADAERKARENGGAVLSDNGKRCLPIGMPGMMVNEFAMEVLETDGRVTVLSENSPLPRTIYLTEKEHTKNLEPSWNGHSIGHWEGSKLLVDTVNFNDRTVHVPGGGLTSGSLHLTEQVYLDNGGETLVDEMTFEDPKVLTKPWTVKHTYHRMPPDSELWEYACEPGAAGWAERFAGDPKAKLSAKAKTSAAAQ